MKREWHVGKELGASIYLKERIARSGGNEKYILECKKCGALKNVWTSQMYTGDWKVCDHDLE